MLLTNNYCSFYILLSLFLPLNVVVGNNTNTIQLRDINVLVLTDVHSWVGGHGPNEPDLDINYGHVVSFYERLLDYCESKEKDLYFVVNGDWVDGTGISLNGDVFSLTQVLEKMPWDAVNVGNHELYHENLIEFITKPGGLVDWFGSRYLSSNIVRSPSQEPLGNRYVVMQGKRSAVLTFGFLYNMKDHVDVVDVKEVEAVVQEQWFLDALRKETYDAILVLAHMHVQDPLVMVILNKIREQIGDQMPVQFVTGHTHIRDYAVLDEMSTSFEAGRYLDTLGFVSFPSKDNVEAFKTNVTTNTSLFTHNFLDANKQTLREVLNLDSIDTANGMELSHFIEKIRHEMGLTQEIGCVNQSYFASSATYEPSSLWGFFMRKVVPATLPDKHVLIFSKGDLRYDLLKGKVRVDDIISLSPFNDTLCYWKDLPGSIILQLNESMNANQETSWLPLLPSYILAPTENISTNSSYKLITAEFDVPSIREGLASIYSKSSRMVPEPMDLTATLLWLNYFRDHDSCGVNHSHPSHQHKQHDDRPSIETNTNSTGNHSPVSSPGGPREDKARLLFVGAAMGAIVILGSINIWQRGRRFHQLMSARQVIILEAQNDFSDVDEACCDCNDGESEGLFI